jgi:hypothetical protein
VNSDGPPIRHGPGRSFLIFIMFVSLTAASMRPKYASTLNGVTAGTSCAATDVMLEGECECMNPLCRPRPTGSLKPIYRNVKPVLVDCFQVSTAGRWSFFNIRI